MNKVNTGFKVFLYIFLFIKKTGIIPVIYFDYYNS